MTALRLWGEHGFDRVTWAEIAEAAGVSQRTILRHFSSKEELAWAAVPRATRVLVKCFESAEPGTPVSAVVTGAVVESISALHEHHSSGPLWLRLVSEEPALRASAAAAYQPWVDALAEYLSTSFPEMPAASCHGIASAYRVTAFEALMRWAETDPSVSPTETVSHALEWLNFTAPLPEGVPHPGLRPEGESR